jgi:alpha-galactosidase
MNRNFSDCWSNHLPKDRQGEFVHRYYLGLYNLLARLTQSFPNILFESCASGGNRFDLGMLCYMPQIWTSDNTDAYERQKIQYGTSLLYPPSVMGCHVSGNVNFQVMRSTPLESRFNVAAYGLLGYELDLSSLSPFERSVIRRQIVFYKQYRNLFQYGHFIRLESPFLSNRCLWMVVNEDRSQAIYGYYQKLMKPNPPLERLPLVALAGTVRYRLSTRPQFSRLKTFGTLINMISPISLKEDRFIHNSLDRFYRFPHEIEAFEVEGDELLAHGFAPMHHFTGSGATNQTRIVTDFGSRLYLFEKDGESNET